MFLENKISCSLTTVLYRLFRFLQRIRSHFSNLSVSFIHSTERLPCTIECGHNGCGNLRLQLDSSQAGAPTNECVQLQLGRCNYNCVGATTTAWVQLQLRGCVQLQLDGCNYNCMGECNYNWVGATTTAWVQLKLRGCNYNCVGATTIAWVQLKLCGCNYNCVGATSTAWVQLQLRGIWIWIL